MHLIKNEIRFTLHSLSLFRIELLNSIIILKILKLMIHKNDKSINFTSTFSCNCSENISIPFPMMNDARLEEMHRT